MKRILLGFLSIFMFALTSNAQSDIATYTQKYDKGERNKVFLKEYVTLLMSGKNIAQIEKVADTYLMTIPVNERYEGFNLEVFNKGVKKYDDLSFRDLMRNWDKIINEGNLKLFQKKVMAVYSSSLFNYSYKKENSSEDFRTNMLADVKKLDVNYCNFYTSLLALRYSSEVADFKQLNQNIKKIISNFDAKIYSGWNETYIISSSLSKVVDDGDIATSKELLEILTPYKGKFKWINTAAETLEGKIIMTEN